jgi:hypothetical protein
VTKNLGFTKIVGYGSWESHRHVAQRALELDVFAQARKRGDIPAIIVFEDDVQFVDDISSHALKKLERQILEILPDGWHMLLLGHFPVPVPGTCRPANIFGCDWSVWRVNSLMLHAYILSEVGAQLLVQTPYHKYESTDWGFIGWNQKREHFLDDWMRHHCNMYAVVPMMCVQADSPSDQNAGGKEFGIRLHTRVARHFPFVLETLFMFLPLAALLAFLVVVFIYFLRLVHFAVLPLPLAKS